MTSVQTRPEAPAASASALAEADAVIAVASTCAQDWRRTSPAERAAALRRAADVVRAAAHDLGDLLTMTTGKLLGEATQSALVAADQLEEAAIAGLRDAGRTLAGAPGTADWTRAEPHGVVAVLTPWNDPYPTAAGLLAAALVTGNTVVHKPSERSMAPGLELARLIAASLPEGVLGVLSGDGAVGAHIVRDDRVQLVAHIGSTATGAQIAATAAARGARVILENGGKDPLVVDAGVDPRWAAAQAATGAFTNAGQLCTSVERVYVHRSLAASFLDELVHLAGSLRIGDPRDPSTTLCRLIDRRQLEVVEEHVDDAVARGAVTLHGGTRASEDGPWFSPTVLTDCTPDMLVMTEETFGPVAPVMVVDSWEEGLREAASGDYGLAATVLTPDTAHALQAVGELEVGTVKVNAVFGGAPGGSADPRRSSGQRCGYGPDLLAEMTTVKAVHWEPAPARASRS